jgi:hypothetical protein
MTLRGVCVVRRIEAYIGAVTARRFPAYTAAIETGAGILLIGGIALAGSFLPVIL